MHRRGIQTILVTSGAIGAGMGRLGLKKRPSKISELQAAASVGQSLLMKMYEEALRPYELPAAQALLTTDDLQNRRRYVNFTNALNALFNFGAVPILNENDAVATEEIRVGDNDTLSALTAVAVDADLLILLSDTDGVFTADPRRYPDAERIPVIHEINAELMRMAGESPGGDGTQLGTGRLLTKLKAAQTAGSSGIPTALAHGGRRNSAMDILDGKDVGTFFIPNGERKTGKKALDLACAGREGGSCGGRRGAEGGCGAEREPAAGGGAARVGGFSKGRSRPVRRAGRRRVCARAGQLQRGGDQQNTRNARE